MRLKHLSFLMFAVGLFFAPTVSAADMEIVVWAPADQNERYRFEAVALAANVLNEELKIEGRDIKVTVSSRSFAGSQTWGPMGRAPRSFLRPEIRDDPNLNRR